MSRHLGDVCRMSFCTTFNRPTDADHQSIQHTSRYRHSTSRRLRPCFLYPKSVMLDSSSCI